MSNETIHDNLKKKYADLELQMKAAKSGVKSALGRCGSIKKDMNRVLEAAALIGCTITTAQKKERPIGKKPSDRTLAIRNAVHRRLLIDGRIIYNVSEEHRQMLADGVCDDNGHPIDVKDYEVHSALNFLQKTGQIQRTGAIYAAPGVIKEP